MTTLGQIKRIVGPLVERDPGLFPIGPWLIVKPVRHVVRGILIDRTGDADRFQPRWAVVNLCDPLRSFPLDWGELLYRPAFRLWKWSDPSATADLLQVLKEVAIPVLRPLETLESFAVFVNSDRFRSNPLRSFPLRKPRVDAALGHLDAARSCCHSFATTTTIWHGPAFDRERDSITRDLCPLLCEDDVPGIAGLLREWEAFTARNLKIESIWEPTPFPLELQSR